MNTPSSRSLEQPRTKETFRRIKLLVGTYLGLSVLTLLAVVLLRNDHAAVNSAVWIRGSIVAVSSVLLYAFAVRAARGARGAWRRLTVISSVMVAVIVVIVALPGGFPEWMKIEQGVCGLLLIGVVGYATTLRSVFTPGQNQV
ncbi:hypothetical protein [Streptomyces sp. NBC_01197]|uniref:hypothetical protein n=1 Tax=Streptomyces sp. NBC_01197 TaxID=2903768 RepID=UPI002E0FC443|nr:hypothetical protein OG452_25135 [Streptomyces sp. NBC_01197]